MIINRNSLKRLLKSQNIPRAGVQYVLDIYDSNTPSRRPSGNHMSVHDTIASRKMMWTQNSESRSAELPFLLSCEFRHDVLLYFCQPTPIKISYRNSKDKKVTYLAGLDYLVITKNAVFLVECKKQEWLESEISNNPKKFQKTTSGYIYPPAEEAASELGIKVIVSTDRDFTTSFTRNCQYLLNYIDDLKYHNEHATKEIQNSIRTNGNRMRFSELSRTFTQTQILQGVFHKKLFADIDSELLVNPESVWIYEDISYFNGIKDLKKEKQLIPIINIESLSTETAIWWGDKEFEILNLVTTPRIQLNIRDASNRIVSLSESNIYELLEKQELYIKKTVINDETRQLLFRKKAYQVEEARKRLAMIQGHTLPTFSSRTLSRYKKKIKTAMDPLVAVMSNKEKRGNRNPRLSSSVIKLIDKYFEELLKPAPAPVYHVWKRFWHECKNSGYSPCSYETFNKRFKSIDKYTRTLKQKGFKAAYALGPRPREIDLEWDLPCHGDYIFEIVHADHTPIEIKLKSALTGQPLDKTLYLSTMYDGHSRVVLAVHISFEAPSYRSTMMLLRECYRRYKRFPIFMVVDHGPDFQSCYFDSTMADLGIHKRNRPTSASRHGSIIERCFGTTETEFIHHLSGNKQLQKLGRGLSGSHKPDKFVEITPDEFEMRLKDYAYLQSPHTNRRGISETPHERWKRSASKFDELPGTKALSEYHVYLSTLAEADRKGTRILNENQLNFRGCNYRLSSNVPGYDGKKASIPVRYDPYDITYAWGLINNRWVLFKVDDPLVRECFDKGIRLAHMEVASRRYRDSKRKRNLESNSQRIKKNLTEKECSEFNLKKSSIGNPIIDENHLLDPPSTFSPSINNIHTLPISTYSKGGHDE
ncbi:transposase family protein [Aestuariicella sp. G3-2]|uniref:integrase catalytic domain-containing protein n=1 Tax=Pseudomaricurvus albidus TaxID=2842452 RepID=UPI001C0BBAFE|nr:DDE-type integrase/transposase/recombinase [Aestuariicella albida]MBU3068262.1 transposase family protein [Aestuariicella albida]